MGEERDRPVGERLNLAAQLGRFKIELVASGAKGAAGHGAVTAIAPKEKQ